MKFLFPSDHCTQRKQDTEGNFVNIKKSPWILCYVIVAISVLDALNSLQYLSSHQEYAIANITLDLISAFAMYKHCSACRGLRGFFATLFFELVGKTVLTYVVDAPPSTFEFTTSA